MPVVVRIQVKANITNCERCLTVLFHIHSATVKCAVTKLPAFITASLRVKAARYIYSKIHIRLVRNAVATCEIRLLPNVVA